MVVVVVGMAVQPATLEVADVQLTNPVAVMGPTEGMGVVAEPCAGVTRTGVDRQAVAPIAPAALKI